MSESTDETRLAESGDEEPRRVSGGVWVNVEDLVGRTLDERYIVDELIGQGAMGAVFRARQTRLRRTVALKVPKPELCTMPEFIGRFEREALSMARLVHQNIVQIFDVCVSDKPSEPTFIVMEYVEGVELDKFLRSQEKDLTVAAVVEIFRQIADGLDVAHGRGIVHRDIKPANIIITMPQRVAKSMDFGVAKIALENAYETLESKAIGTPAYMAPEQVQGKDVTPAADLYSFAVMMYRLLTRSLPYDAKTSSGLLFAHVSDPPIPPTRRNPNLPAAFDAVMEKALAKDPGQRHESARELADAVASALDAVQGRQIADLLASAPFQPELEATQSYEAAARKSAPWFRRWPAMAGAGAVLLLLIVAVLAQFGDGGEPPGEPDTAVAAMVVDIPAPAPPETDESAAAVQATPSPVPAPSPRPTSTPRRAPPTPVPTPEATQVIAAEPDRWDPELFPPALGYLERKQTREAIEKYVRDRIAMPLREAHFGPAQNDLATMEGETAAAIISAIRTAAPDYAAMDARFRIADDSVLWQDRAMLRLELNVYGRPVTIRDRSYRESILKTEEPLAARAVLTENGWKLIRLTGDIPKIDR